MPLTRDEIVHTAVRMLDEVGLEGLSLRRLASALQVRAPTLYWHVRDKRHLLDLMAEAILADVVSDELSRPRQGQAWWDWLAEGSRAMFYRLIAHRDAALVVAGNRPTEASVPHVERTLDTLVTVGFPPAEALQTMFALGMYVMGCAVEWQAEAARPPAHDAEKARGRERLREDYPILGSAVSDLRIMDHTATFEHGLRLMIEGLRARHAELTGMPEPAEPTRSRS